MTQWIFLRKRFVLASGMLLSLVLLTAGNHGKLVGDLKQLAQLYKEGALQKDEFVIAKAIMLKEHGVNVKVQADSKEIPRTASAVTSSSAIGIREQKPKFAKSAATTQATLATDISWARSHAQLCTKATAADQESVRADAATFAPTRRASEHQYCLWQCGKNFCCPGGTRNLSHFKVVQDSRLPLAGNDDVTLVTQGSFGRIGMLDLVDARWKGPKVVVFIVYNPAGQEWEDLTDTAKSELAGIKKRSASWSNILVVSFVASLMSKKEDAWDYWSKAMPKRYQENPTDSKTERSHALMTIYPINTLRNVAVDLATTNWVFPTDIDFAPSAMLYARLRSAYLPRFAAVPRIAVVVPHFDTRHKGQLDLEVPADFRALNASLYRGEWRPFAAPPSLLGQDLNYPSRDDWPEGVSGTDYKTWFARSKAGVVGMFPLVVEGTIARRGPLKGQAVHPDRWVPTNRNEWWEPYVIVRRHEPAAGNQTLPRYPEQFVGRYFNKLAFVAALRAQRYKFFALDQEFLVHQPHPEAMSYKEKNSITLRKGMAAVHAQFLQELVKQHDRAAKPETSKYDEGWQLPNCIGVF